MRARPSTARISAQSSARSVRFASDPSDSFFPAVKSRVGSYLASRPEGRFGGRILLLRSGGLAAAAVAAYGLAVFGNLPGALALLAAILSGLASVLVLITVGHEASHDTLTPSPRINRIAAALAFAPVGADPILWRIRHVRSHHVAPNVHGFDVDVGENGVLRLSAEQAWRPAFRYQHLYAPLAYLFAQLYTAFVYDPLFAARGRMANLDLRRPGLGRIALGKLVFLFLALGLPLLAADRPWWQVVCGALIVTGINSLVFVALVVGPHHNDLVSHPEAREGALPHGWARHQLATALDWSPINPVAAFLSGGTNAHAAHHLFPNVSHIHYGPITRIIREEAIAHDLPYHATDFPGMLRAHFRHLRALGRRPETAPQPG